MGLGPREKKIALPLKRLDRCAVFSPALLKLEEREYAGHNRDEDAQGPMTYFMSHGPGTAGSAVRNGIKAAATISRTRSRLNHL